MNVHLRKPKFLSSVMAMSAIVALTVPLIVANEVSALVINTWTNYQNQPSSDQWRGATFDGSKFIIVNDSTGIFATNNVRTSSDGINWTSETITGDNRMQDIACGDGDCVVANYGKNGLPVNQGSGWVRSSIPAKDWVSVAYGGSGKFMVISSSFDRDVIISLDRGDTWTATATKFSEFGMYEVAYGEGVWVVAGNYWIQYSNDDGATWNVAVDTVPNPERANFQSVEYANGMFMTTGQSGSVTSIYTSPDGITWTAQPGALPGYWSSLGYGDGYWITATASGSSEQSMVSEDNGVTWTLIESSPLAAENVVYGNGVWLIAGYSGTSVGSYVAPTTTAPTTTTSGGGSTTTTSGGGSTTTTSGGSNTTVPDDSVVEALPDGDITDGSSVEPGAKIRLKGPGFVSGERVVGVVAGHGSLIGSGRAGGDGEADIEVTVPEGLSGEQTFALYAPRSGRGYKQVLTISGAEELPPTGSDSRGLALALSVIGAGLVLLVGIRNRSRV